MGACDSKNKTPKNKNDGVKIKEVTKEYPLFKLLMLGDVACGKTSLLSQYCDGIFDAPTFDFKEKQMDIKGMPVRAQFWDTAGQERFRVITSSYYRESHGMMLCFDLTREATFKSLNKWITEIGRFAEPETVILLVGNKSDLVNDIQVTDVMVEDWMEEKEISNINFMKTSAKGNEGVKEAFEALVAEVIEKHNAGGWADKT